MFPLESALLPDQDLPLRIFEPRYGALVRHCLDSGDPFGVVLISRGREVGGGDARCDVGVLSRITECVDHGAGRYSLHCRTGERIRVSEWLPDDPYPRATVTLWPDEPGDPVTPAQLLDVEDRVMALFERIADARGVVLPDRDGALGRDDGRRSRATPVRVGVSHPDRHGRPLRGAVGARRPPTDSPRSARRWTRSPRWWSSSSPNSTVRQGQMKVHLQVDGSPTEAAASAADIAATGADGLFTFEGQHDVFFPLIIAAGATGLDLMTNVAIAPPRSPLHLAHAAYDLQLYSGGRFRLGLGSQVKAHIEKRYGSKWERPAARMAETVAAIKAIFAAWEGQGRMDFRGEFFTHTIMAPNFNPGPNPFGPPPVLLGALGPVMTRTAAEVADGLLVMPFNSARHFAERTIPAVGEGLRRVRATAPTSSRSSPRPWSPSAATRPTWRPRSTGWRH